MGHECEAFSLLSAKCCPWCLGALGTWYSVFWGLKIAKTFAGKLKGVFRNPKGWWVLGAWIMGSGVLGAQVMGSGGSGC